MHDVQLKITNADKHLEAASQPNAISDKEKNRIAKAAKEFESLFTTMMLKSMTKNTQGMFGEDSYGGDIYSSMFQSQIGKYISDGKGIGIADMLYKKLTGETLAPEQRYDALGQNLKSNININGLENTNDKIFPSNSSIDRLSKYNSIIEDAANNFGVDKNVIKSVIMTESAGNSKAVSSAKAKGLMQLMDSTAKDLGVKNVWNPKENIYAGTKYLSQLLRQYNGDVKLALAGYNAGPGNVDKYEGVPPFEETKNYISRVMGYLNYFNAK